MDPNSPTRRRHNQPPISVDHVSYARHGHWIRHRDTGVEGRIGCELPANDQVAVVWDPGGYGWCRLEELEDLPDREPQPWYRRLDILRRRTDGRDDDLWWEDAPEVRWPWE